MTVFSSHVFGDSELAYKPEEQTMFKDRTIINVQRWDSS